MREQNPINTINLREIKYAGSEMSRFYLSKHIDRILPLKSMYSYLLKQSIKINANKKKGNYLPIQNLLKI